MIAMVLLLAGCQSRDIPKAEEIIAPIEGSTYTFVDALENSITIEESPKAVVALTGSYAETWVLAGGELSGVTDDVVSERQMVLPENIKMLGRVKEPSLEAILAASPDFVILSPDIESHHGIAEVLKKSDINHAFFKVEEFEDYLNMLDIFTEITGRKEQYEINGLNVQKQIEAVLSKVDPNTQPSVLFIRAFSSGAKAKMDDNMTGKMLKDIGTVNIASKHESLLEDLSIEAIIEEDPDFIFVTTMGDTEEAMEAMKNGIEKNPAWANLSAVKNGRYIVLPKDLFHYKPNSKWGESYEYLAKIIYPELFK
jgi:iron complex transport system substrate-binding protein